jgi:hypothetical protein
MRAGKHLFSGWRMVSGRCQSKEPMLRTYFSLIASAAQQASMPIVSVGPFAGFCGNAPPPATNRFETSHDWSTNHFLSPRHRRCACSVTP